MLLTNDGRVFPKKDDKEKGEYSVAITYEECFLIEGKYLYGWATSCDAFALADKKTNKSFQFPGLITFELNPENVIDKFVIDQIGTDGPFKVQLRYDQSPKDQSMIAGAANSEDIAKLVSQSILQGFQILEKAEKVDPSKFEKPSSGGGRSYSRVTPSQLAKERLELLTTMDVGEVLAAGKRWGLEARDVLTLLLS
jgi:hypothetical protein